MPKISIIVPVYNVENIVGECIESILQQNYTDFELLLINDGSKDDSLDVCNAYAQKDNRIIVISKENGGVSKARNLGIEKAKGEWITFIDSDDWVSLDYLSIFDVDNASDISLVISGLEYMDNRSGKLINTFSYNEKVFIRADFKDEIPQNRILLSGFPVGKAFRKDLICQNNIRFDDRISYHEDHIFVFDYLLHCHCIKLCKENTYKYRVYHNALSLSSKRHSWKQLYISSIGLVSRLKLLCQKYDIDQNCIELQKVSSFCYSPLVSSLYAIYDLNESRKDRKLILSQILVDKRGFRKGFYPRNNKERLIRIVVGYCPLVIVDFYFSYLHLYHNRNNK